MRSEFDSRFGLQINHMKVGDTISFLSLPKDAIKFSFDKSRGKYSPPFEHLIDPTDGGGGANGKGDVLPETMLNKWEKENRDVITDIFGNYVLSLFIPKNKQLAESAKILTELSKSLRGNLSIPDKRIVQDKILAIQETISKLAPLFGVLQLTESYKILVSETDFKKLPSDVIGTTAYDYSFHAGEGEVGSWLMTFGKSESEIKSKLMKGLAKVKVQYVGNAMALKYAQKDAIGRYD